jgi:putative DNA primase/helicase
MNEVVRAPLSAEAIEAQAERNIDAYLDGGYDLEAADIEAAIAARVDPAPIVASWSLAKTLRPSGSQSALFISPATQPSIAAKPNLASVATPIITRRLGPPTRSIAAAIAAPLPVASVEAKPVVPEPSPAPAPIVTAEAAVVLSPQAPYDTAKEFARRHCHREGQPVVWFWQGQFWRWNGRFYATEPDEIMRGLVYAFLDGASKWSGNQTVKFQPNPRHVNEVLDCLKTGLALGVECQPPMWLDPRKPATEMIVFQNGIVNVLTGEMQPLSHRLWAHSALGFDWRPEAGCPAWRQFLENVFPGDTESAEFLEEWMGYCMTEETKFQKGAMLVGPKRSGKGTICHVLRQMVGDGSYVGLSFNTWAASENSRECLVGKRVGVFADVRFKPGRAYGQSFDPGGIGHVSSELLLNIIGEDTVTIGRKYKGPWHGQLRLKLMLISNEVPNLNDAGGVLPSRFVKLRFGVSFFGREDVNLRARLEGELSGIAARCVRAYQRLCERGKLIQPRSAEALEQAVLASSDPFAAMALECFAADAEGSVSKTIAYNRFEAWCRANGRIDMSRNTPANKFGAKLQALPGFEHISTWRPHGGPRSWSGLRLKPKED